MASSTIAYAADHPLHQFDLHSADTSPPPPLICFIHGGAWRSEDKAHYAGLAQKLVAATGCAVAVPNYRLTLPNNDDPQFRHPMHAEDLRAFLHFVIDYPSEAFDPSRLVLIGHSCSAHMLASVLMDSADPRLVPSQRLLSAVKGVIMSEGIYDLDTLLTTFPTYREWFIAPTFGPDDTYPQFSALQFPLRAGSNIRWLLLHSKGDTLVDEPQTTSMYTHLRDVDPQNIEINVDDLKEDHNDILATDEYVTIVKNFVENIRK